MKGQPEMADIIKKVFFFGIVFIYTALFLPTLIHAATVETDSYSIESSSVDADPPTPMPTSESEQDNSPTIPTTTFLSTVEYEKLMSDGYVIRSNNDLSNFITFSSTNPILDFGELTADSTKQADTTLMIKHKGGYQVEVEKEDISGLSQKISDTTCNGGSDTCSPTHAAIWDDHTKKGIGYAMSGNDIPYDFFTTDFFRPFNVFENKKSPAYIMSNLYLNKQIAQSKMTLKLHTPINQTSSSYQMILHFAIVPLE
jgi:hypothetical protein